MKILITIGGTEEPIDGVRRLTNTSTGATGRLLASHFARHGAEVFTLHARRVDVSDLPVKAEAFETFDDLSHSLQRLLGSTDFDAVLHLAAVGDYRIVAIELDGESRTPCLGKISGGKPMTLRLEPNPKLIDRMRDWSRNPALTVVGFKLTNGATTGQARAAVDHILERGVADLVVHNDLGKIRGSRHEATLYSASGVIDRVTKKTQLARALFNVLAEETTS